MIQEFFNTISHITTFYNSIIRNTPRYSYICKGSRAMGKKLAQDKLTETLNESGEKETGRNERRGKLRRREQRRREEGREE